MSIRLVDQLVQKNLSVALLEVVTEYDLKMLYILYQLISDHNENIWLSYLWNMFSAVLLIYYYI